MLAGQKFGNGETPESSNLKGDHLVGKYYVIFDQEYKKQIKILVEQGISEKEAGKKAPILLEAQEMLRRWEEGDRDIISLWKKMNEWVYQGFEITYQELGIHFDKTYYESETYLLGKQLVEEGLNQGAFYRKDDGSVWVNLNDEGMDEKLLLRQDGTSVYMTQDLGTASLRFDEFHPEKMIYVVGNEQNYHFDVLKIILSKKLKKSFGNHIHHLSYGMVELPSGKMKSREGTVVDADNLMEEMIVAARRNTQELGKTDFSNEEAECLYRMIGLGALKYFILKVDPKKNMLFNPEESIDLNGNTAPFIQYTYARIRSLLRKADKEGLSIPLAAPTELTIPKMEKELIKLLYDFPQIIENAGTTYSPAVIANYMFDLAKAFNRFYQETPIFKETSLELKIFRLQISNFISIVLRNGMALLGIDLPEKM
jgi:arginyl-tRNA synthetase